MEGYFVIMAHNEKHDLNDTVTAKATEKSGDENRFGKKGLIKKAKEFNGGKEPVVIRSEKNEKEDFKMAKKALLDSVKSPNPQLRLVLDAHGAGSFIFLGDMDKEKYSIKEIIEASAISAIELADAMLERYKNNPQLLKAIKADNNKRDVIFGLACKGNDFAQMFQLAFTNKLVKYNTELMSNGGSIDDMIFFRNGEGPIFLPAAEYGQNVISDIESKYGNSYWEDIFKLDNKDAWGGDKPTLKLFFENQHDYRNSNPSFFEIDGFYPKMLGDVSDSTNLHEKYG